ncbi:MAG: outer membrane beta-barrel protein [Longimicrobiales bacterium]
MARALKGCVIACGLALVGGLAAGTQTPVEAQTAQMFSVQVSGLGNKLFGDEFVGIETGFGFEAQIRYNPSAFSVGGGFQYTSHGVDIASSGVVFPPGTEITTTLTGVFVEPRYVIDMQHDNVAPYVSARFSLSDITLTGAAPGLPEVEVSDTGFTANAGGGILYRLSPRANLDFGATFGIKTLNYDDTQPTATGTNLIFRVGVAFGLGG